MIFSNADIQRAIEQGLLSIEPFDITNVRSASYWIRLGELLFFPKNVAWIDTRVEKQAYDSYHLTEEGYLIQPDEFLVVRSREKIILSNEIAGLLTTTGSRGQMGLDTTLNTSFIDPGFADYLALPIHNVGKLPIKVFPGTPLAKVIFFPVQTKADQMSQRNFLVRNDFS